MRKAFAVPAALLGLALVTVVVAAATAQARSEKSQVTTVTLSGWSSSPEENELLNQVVATFNRTHTAVQIDYSVIHGDYTTAMTARFAAHNPPDVFYVDSSKFPEWREAGRASAAEHATSQTTQVQHSRVHPGPAQLIQGREDDVRVPEGLVAARDGDQHSRC